MKQYELMQYRDYFNNMDGWRTLTENLDKQTIRSIKRLLLKHEIYKDFDFNSDHLEAIEKLQVGRKESSVWNGGSDKTVSVTFDRINSTVELTITENGKEINKSKVSVDETVIELFFRMDIEPRITRYQMEKENMLPIMHVFDAPIYSGTVTWYKNDQVCFCARGEYEPVNVNRYIEEAKKMIVNAIERSLPI